MIVDEFYIKQNLYSNKYEIRNCSMIKGSFIVKDNQSLQIGFRIRNNILTERDKRELFEYEKIKHKG